MAVEQPTLFSTKAHQAIQMARRKSESFFVSEILQVESVDPVGFYAAGKTFFQGERFFWKNADESLQLIGLGNAFSIISAEDAARFAQVESEWKKFKQRVIVANGQDRKMGTGPVLFGGFSFDPQNRNHPIWENFPNALFFVPKFLLTIYDKNEMYITITFVCNPDDKDDIGVLAHKELQHLLSAAMVPVQAEQAKITAKVEIQPDEWKQSVARAIQSLKRQELAKVVLSRQLELTFHSPVSEAHLLKTLCAEQKDSFVFSLNWRDASFIGATPERLVRKTGEVVESTCLAGSINRGKNAEEDEQLGQWLLTDQKNVHEHQYVVQQISGVFANLCADTEVSPQPELLKMRDIQHIYTGVKGKALPEVSLLDFVEGLHPTPALGGTPREKAMKMIRELERTERGYYASPIGWIDYDDNGEFVVGIRSGLVSQNRVTLYAGCGIVADSEPDKEYEETMIKFRPMLSALGGMDN